HTDPRECRRSWRETSDLTASSNQMVENRGTQHLKTESDGENSAGSEPDRNHDPDNNLHPATSHSFGSKTDHNSFPFEERSDPKSGLNPLQNKDKGVKPFCCSVCGKRYPQKRSLANHMRLHSEGKFFSCSICKKTFPWKRDVLTHMRIHTGEKPFSCSFCGTRFSQSSHLTLHLRVHTGEKPFTCSVCNTSFSVRKSLVDHMTTHTGEKPHKCSVCGKRFAQNGALRRHLAVHTGEKPFNCSVCDKRFTRLEHVKNHKTHTEEKPFSSSVGGTRFSVKSNLNSDLNTHTGGKLHGRMFLEERSLILWTLLVKQQQRRRVQMRTQVRVMFLMMRTRISVMKDSCQSSSVQLSGLETLPEHSHYSVYQSINSFFNS
uniref:C2H2-type domain-containing protein n=1 Tax=Labrus bergylta TaxID=56723 RepID=A0A3Q3F1T0_9LABR